MRSIGEFFSRIQNRHSQELYIRSAIVESIKKVTTVSVPMDKISFKGASIVLQGVTHTEKSHIFLKKTAILKDIESKNIGRVIRDIR